MRHIALILTIATLGALTGCYSFQGARENVAITGPMVDGTWAPCCEECCREMNN